MSELDELTATAERTPENGTDDEMIQLIVVRTNARLYCARIDEIRMIAPISSITYVPGAAPHVLGVFNWRGEIVPVIDLEMLLDTASTGSPGETRSFAMIANVDGVPTGVGCAVDELVDIWTRPSSAIQPPLSTFDENAAQFVQGQLEDNGALIPLLTFGALGRVQQEDDG